MPKVTIKSLSDALDLAQKNVASYRCRNGHLEEELKIIKIKIEELTRDKRWLQQLCQEQSSSIAGYMRSR